MDLEDFKDYQAEDFVLNDSFQAYVLGTNVYDREFWQFWILNHKEQEEEFYQAVVLVKALSSTQPAISEQAKDKELNRLLAGIEEPEATAKVIALSNRLNGFTLAGRLIAATISGLLLLGAALIFIVSNTKPADLHYQTAYGEIRKVVLPDSSEVVLNSNSKLITSAEWNKEKRREVWVSGEAFFSVTHKKNNQKFTVTTAKGLQIEVLGTEFNVLDRKYKNSVVLRSGKIKLAVPRPNQSPAKMVLAPGELVEYNADTGSLIRKKVNPDMYSSWQENVLVFDNATLAEISALLQESYGIPVVIGDEKLADVHISGVASTLDVEGFLRGLSKLHRFKVRQVNKSFHLESDGS
jgi:transmembrane sensor